MSAKRQNNESKRPVWTSNRAPHRARSDEEAHAVNDGHQHAAILDHAMVCRAEPDLVTTPVGLDSLLNELRTAGSFGYDTEFIGEQSYHPRLCLVQTATPTRLALIDPLADLDLTPFWELVADASVEKIVHAGQPDLEPVVRLIKRPPANVFDVQIAAGFVGVRYPSALRTLVSELLNGDLGHVTKFSQWDRRPLTELQMRYAANDVRYLPLLRQTIGGKLAESGLTTWVAEECQSLCDPELYEADATSQRMRVRGATELSPRQRAILRELVLWRDATAEAENAPVRALLADDVMLTLVRSPVKSVAELDRVKGLPRAVEDRFGREIVEATKRGQEIKVEEFDSRPPRDLDAHRARIEHLWKIVAARAAERRIDPALVSSKKELGKLVYGAEMRAVPEHDLESRLNQGWRSELMGEAWSTEPLP